MNPAEPVAVSAIVEHHRQRGRYRVMVGDEQLALVSARLVAELSLRVGGVLDAPAQAVLARESAVLAAYDKGIALLAVRARASRELERKLLRAGFEKPSVDSALERLAADGHLDDERFSLLLSRTRLGGGKVARRRVEQELGRLGVDREVARDAVERVASEEEFNEGDAALALARRRASSLRGVSADAARRRLFGYLVRRGFESSHASAAVAAALDEIRAEHS